MRVLQKEFQMPSVMHFYHITVQIYRMFAHSRVTRHFFNGTQNNLLKIYSRHLY
jgi:hypothetical protein